MEAAEVVKGLLVAFGMMTLVGLVITGIIYWLRGSR